MAIVRPFPALRPAPELAAVVSCLPYDVMNHQEACEMARGNEISFLHVSRSDIDLDSPDKIHDDEAYAKARENLVALERNNVLRRDSAPGFYIYRQTMNGRPQTGIVACVSVDEYLEGSIKRHELTRKEKELDRIRHFDVCGAQTEPVFLAYRESETVNSHVDEWISSHAPAYDFVSSDGVGHVLWHVDESAVISALKDAFSSVPTLYIADGHHRTASGVETCRRRRETCPDYTGEEEFNFLMAVIFPDSDLLIMDYNRVVRDLNGLTVEAFMSGLEKSFAIVPQNEKQVFRPVNRHEFGLYLDGRWYALMAKGGSFPENDPINSLDCALLQNNVLSPLLGIQDPRTDTRIDFIGGIRGLEELERRCAPDTGDMRVAFALSPVTMADLFSVADAGEIMPPKSTWFEPKLRSGLFVHSFDNQTDN